MDRPDQTTHFGFRDVALGDKQTLVNDVFHSVAPRYDLMNDLMSAGLHRVWKELMINALNPPRSDTPFALLDVAGGTGDIAFRAAKAAGAGFHATVCDINSDMLEVGRERAMAQHLDDRVSFVEGNAEALAFPDRRFDAYTIAFGIRNVPRIDLALREAFRVLKPGGRFLCLEFSTVDVPGLDRIYDLFSFKVIPPLGRAVTGDAESYRYLVESIRKFPRPNAFAEMIRAAGFSRVVLAEPLRRHRGAAFGLAFVISALTHIARLARAGFVFAREGVFGVVDPQPGAAARTARAAARAADRTPRRQIRPAAVARADAARARPISSSDSFSPPGPTWSASIMARDLESLQDRLPPFSQAEAEAVIATSLERPVAQAFASFGPAVAAASIAQVHRGETERDGVAHRGRGEGAAAQRRRALPPRPRRFLLCRAQGRSAFGGSAAAAADRGHQHDVALGGDGDGSAAGGRRAVGDGGEHPRRSGFSRAHRRLGPHHPQCADDGMDRRHCAQRSCRASSRRRSICPISAAR